MNTKYYDVIVAGAGPAGICAAVAAARQGARVALIERYGVIGGNLTAGYVGPILGSVSKNTMRDEVCAILGVKDNDWIGEHGNAHDFEEAKLTLAEFVAREKNVDVFLQCCRAWASTILQAPQPCITWAASSPCWVALLSHNKLRFLQDEICNNQKKYNTRNNEKSSNLDRKSTRLNSSHT